MHHSVTARPACTLLLTLLCAGSFSLFAQWCWLLPRHFLLNIDLSCEAQTRSNERLFMFQFDNILMEEAAQILEIETFIPLLLQVFS
jgi:hypothetical protein